MAAVFVFLTASTRKEDAAIASGAFYLANSLGEVMGIAVQNCVLQGTLRRVLRVRLREVEGCDQVSRFHVSSSFFGVQRFRGLHTHISLGKQYGEGDKTFATPAFYYSGPD